MFKKLKNFLFSNISNKQTIAKNSFWLLAGEGIFQLTMFVLLIFIARYLGTSGYGVFSFVFAFVALFTIFADIGLSLLTVRELARKKENSKKYIDNITIIKLFLGIFTFAIIAIVIQFMGKSSDVITLVYLAAIWVVIQSFIKFFQSIFRAFEKMQYEALSKIVYSIILIGIAAFVMVKDLGINLLIQGYIYASLIAFIITIILIRKKFTKFSFKINLSFWKKILKRAWPFALSMILMILYFKIDTVMLSVLKTDFIVGAYNAAYNIVLVVLGVIGLVNTSLLPFFSRKYREITKFRKFIVKYSLFLFCCAIIFVLVCFFLGGPIINLIYGQAYANSINLLQILCLVSLFLFPNTFFGLLLISLNKERFALFVNLISVIVNITFNILLIPPLGAVGAGIATIITSFSGSLIQILFLRKIFKKIKRKENNEKTKV